MYRRVAAVELQSLVVSLAGQLGINVAQILMGRGITRVGSYGLLQCGAGLVKLALSGVEHGQVVVGLRQFWVVFGQLVEGRNRLIHLARIALDHALEEAHLRVPGFGCQKSIRLGLRFHELARTQQLQCIRVVVGARGPYEADCQEQQGREDR